MPAGHIVLLRSLRRRSTDTENYLWKYLHGKRFFGFKFRRQHRIGPYIVDFVCLEKKLVVELDGGQHAEQIKKDTKRDSWLGKEGYRVLRFWDNEVFENTSGVLEKIAEHCL